MKIIIEAQTEQEKKTFGKKIILGSVFEFGIIGRHIEKKLFESTFSHLHVADKCILEGKLYELIARLKNGP